ncbi:MAG: hypothetical protein IT323_22260 [Anaerolineae bacterium]|nr:hypothetical protein [Anaerolineae bacterium]
MKEIDYHTLRRRIILRWLNRVLFVIHILAYFAIAMERIFWNQPNHSLAMFIWFLVLLLHGAWAFGVLGSFMHRQMDREAERLRAQGYTVIAPAGRLEKPKRAARLADDGEIEYEDETLDPDEAHAAQRRAQN